MVGEVWTVGNGVVCGLEDWGGGERFLFEEEGYLRREDILREEAMLDSWDWIEVHRT